MKCGRARALLSAYIDGELSHGQRDRLDGHLVLCADCRRRLESLRETVGLIASAGEVEMPAAARTALDRAVEKELRVVRTRATSEISAVVPDASPHSEETATLVEERLGLPPTARPPAWRVVLRYSPAIAAVAAVFLFALLLQRPVKQGSVLQTERQRTPAFMPGQEGAEPRGGTAGEGPTLQGPAAREDSSKGLQGLAGPTVEVSGHYYVRSELDALLNEAERLGPGATVEDVTRLQQAFVSQMLAMSDRIGADTRALGRGIQVAIDTPGPALPISATSARFEGKPAWIILVKWGKRSAGSPLTGTAVYVSSIVDQKLLYSRLREP